MNSISTESNNPAIDLRLLLSRRVNIPDVRLAAAFVADNAANQKLLWNLLCSPDRTTSVNALWVTTHLPASESAWTSSHRSELVDMLLGSDDTSKRRMLLQILRGLKYGPADIRIDLLDYCLSKINSQCEPYAVRAFCIYVAFKMCRHYPELVAELSEHLSIMSQQTLPPGLACARRKTLAEIEKSNPIIDSHKF